MEMERQEMAQEMAQQKSIEMLAFFSTLESKERKQLIENAPDTTSPEALQEMKEITELENQILRVRTRRSSLRMITIWWSM